MQERFIHIMRTEVTKEVLYYITVEVSNRQTMTSQDYALSHICFQQSFVCICCILYCQVFHLLTCDNID